MDQADSKNLDRPSRIPDAMLARIECLVGMTFDERLHWIGEMIAALEKARAEQIAAAERRTDAYARIAGEAFGEIVAVRLKCLEELRARLIAERAGARPRLTGRR